MINVVALAQALETRLLADATVSAAKIERGQRVNADPGRCPWVGVYPGTVSTVSFAIGAGSSRWQGTLSLQVIVQVVDFSDDGAAASDALEVLVAAVESAVASNAWLTTGARVVGFDREYRYVEFDADGQGTLFVPQCNVKINLEVKTS